MNIEITQIKAIAEEYRFLYRKGLCDRETAKEKINPYIFEVNKKAIEISKKYKILPKLVDFTSFVR